MSKWLEPQEIGRRVRAIRERLGLKQSEFAERLGMPGSQSHISVIERGAVMPQRDTLERIAALAGESLAIFQRSNGVAATDEIDTVEIVLLARLIVRVLDREASAAEKNASAAEKHAEAAVIRAHRIPDLQGQPLREVLAAAHERLRGDLAALELDRQWREDGAADERVPAKPA